MALEEPCVAEQWPLTQRIQLIVGYNATLSIQIAQSRITVAVLRIFLTNTPQIHAISALQRRLFKETSVTLIDKDHLCS